jgi:hypothetical protein
MLGRSVLWKDGFLQFSKGTQRQCQFSTQNKEPVKRFGVILSVLPYFNLPGEIHVSLVGVCVFPGFYKEETQVNRNDKKSFYRYSDSASERELESKLVQLQSLLLKLKQPETIADAEWMAREISLELDARRPTI